MLVMRIATTFGRKCVLKYYNNKNVFSGAVTKFEKNGVLKYHFKIFVTVPNEHPNAVTVKNCVLKYTPETCVLVMLFSNTVTIFLINYMQSWYFLFTKTVTKN